ncbi:MAG: hypothetical protein U1A78_15205 [Polyangia bacterium]
MASDTPSASEPTSAQGVQTEPGSASSPPPKSQHQFLEYATSPPDGELVRQITRAVLFQYTGINKSKSHWQKQGRFELSRRANNGQLLTSGQLTFKDFEQHISQTRGFDHNKFNLYMLICPWLETDFGIGLNNFTGSAYKLTHGTIKQLPIEICLDREGKMFSSCQGSLQRRIAKLRHALVTTSASFQDDDWFDYLRSYCSNCISLVDITLHQIYIKCEYDPLPGWAPFDADKLEELSPRFGGSLKKKLKWVNYIGKTSVQYAKEELAAFDEVKALRNHMTHWDPPDFCYTMEDAARWLNALPHLASMLWKMRIALGGEQNSLSSSLIELLLAPKVKFVPSSSAPRTPQSKQVGYASSQWPAPPVTTKQSEQKFGVALSADQLKALQAEANRRSQANPEQPPTQIADVIRGLVDAFVQTQNSASSPPIEERGPTPAR